MKFKNYTSLNIFYSIIVIIVLLLNLIFTQLPLLNTLGYEFSALNSLLLIIISGFYTITFLKLKPDDLKTLFIQLIILVILPLLVSIIHSLFTMFCSFTDGIIFYLLIAFPSIVIGSSIGIFTLLYFNKFPKSFFVLIIILLASIPVFEIYFNPQVFFYSPLIGFFPGNIYDEGMSPDLKLLFHQILISIYFISIIMIFSKYKDLFYKNKGKFAAALIVVPIIFQFVSPTLGYTTTYCKLESHLSKKIITANTTLHYDNLSKSEADFIALNQQYYFELLKKKLNVAPTKRIDVYLFNSREQKKQLFGAGNADVAKPWQYSVYISKDSWKSTLKHELIHVFSAEFGSGIFKLANNFNAAMIEGFAEAVDNDVDNLSLINLTSLAFKNGHRIDINNLFGGLNFFKQNSSLSYTYSGAFFHYLIEKYGIGPAKSFYRSGDFENTYKIDLLTMQNKFNLELEETEKIGNKAMADYYFGRLSIIQKVCPRFISDRLKKAWKYLDSKNLTEAQKVFDEVNQKSINYSALIGLSEIYFLQGKTEEAIKLIGNELNKFSGSPYYFNLLFRLGELNVKAGSINSATNIYEELIHENPNFQIFTLAKVRLALIENDEIKKYVEADDSVKYNILLDLNKTNYNYSSIVLLTDLARETKTDYRKFLTNFNKAFLINSVESSYAAFKLSQFMLENGDNINSRKMASLSLRYKYKNPFLFAYQQNYEKANWFFYNAAKVSANFNYASGN